MRSDEYLTEFTRCLAGRKPRPQFQKWVWQAEADFGVWDFNVQKLLDRVGWKTTRPRISVNARLNQSGNLSVTWRPAIVSVFDSCDFESPFLVDTYAMQRDCLLWFRDPPKGPGTVLVSAHEQKAEKLLAEGIVARYKELVTKLGHHLVITSHTKVAVTERRTKVSGRVLQWQFDEDPADEDVVSDAP